jgi:hypothetical protein
MKAAIAVLGRSLTVVTIVLVMGASEPSGPSISGGAQTPLVPVQLAKMPGVGV